MPVLRCLMHCIPNDWNIRSSHRFHRGRMQVPPRLYSTSTSQKSFRVPAVIALMLTIQPLR